MFKKGIRVVCLSDTHGLHSKFKFDIPPGDVLIHAGDFSNTGEQNQIRDFFQWLSTLPHTYKIVIAGNHDLTFQKEFYLNEGARRFRHRTPFDPDICRGYASEFPNIFYLEDSSITLEFPSDSESSEPHRLNFYGSPWQPEFCGWAFNLPRNTGQLLEKWRSIPSNTDVLITHGPPWGVLDLVDDRMEHVGCEEMLAEIVSPSTPPSPSTSPIPSTFSSSSSPSTSLSSLGSDSDGHTCSRSISIRLHVFGHIHEGYGAEFQSREQLQHILESQLKLKQETEEIEKEKEKNLGFRFLPSSIFSSLTSSRHNSSTSSSSLPSSSSSSNSSTSFSSPSETDLSPSLSSIHTPPHTPLSPPSPSCLFVNASTCTFHYRPTNPPVEVFLPFSRTEQCTLVVSPMSHSSDV